MNLLDHFERIYIVNLPERADRRREMEAELAQSGLHVDGSRIRYFRAIRPEDAGLFPSLGARGCFMSHLAIIEEALRDGLDNVLVMEDDLAIDPRLLTAPGAMAQRLAQPDWQFAYLGHIEATSNAPLPCWRENSKPMATTHFYALNRSALEPLRDHLRACLQRSPGHPLGSPMHVDGAYSLYRLQHPGTVTLMTTPSLGGQRSSRSDIYPNKWYDRMPLIRQLAGMARKLKNRNTRRHVNLQGEQHV